MAPMTAAARASIVAALTLVLGACAPTPSVTTPTPQDTPSATTSVLSPSSSPSPSPSPEAPTSTPSATPSRRPLALPPVTASCPAAQGVAVLALATPIGALENVVGVFDARDPRTPKVLCALALPGGRFVSATEIEYPRYATSSAEIVRRDLVTGTERVLTPPGRVTSGFGGLVHAWGHDGKTLVYLAPTDPLPANGCPCIGNSVHLLSGGTDRVLGYFGEIPARDFWAHSGDQATVVFSPSGSKFVAVDTVSGSSKPDASSLRVYSFDGRPLLETSGTMPVWVGERLLFRGCRSANPQCVRSWDGGAVTTVIDAINWDDPVALAQTGLVVFSRWDDSCMGCVVLYDAGANTTRTLGQLRSSPKWVSPTVIWWTEEARCEYPSCVYPSPTFSTDRMHAYDLATGTETLLPFSFVYDIWR